MNNMRGPTLEERLNRPLVLRLDLVKLLFFNEKSFHEYRESLMRSAFNKSYEAPSNPIHLARTAIEKERMDKDKFKALAIEKSKEVSILKRSK